MRNPVSRFAYSRSDIGISRTKFPRSQDHKTTLSAGLLYPLFVDEVLPGDTYSVDMSSLIRMSTPIHPVMDNCYLDTYWFFVPNRIVWDHWKEFMGESPNNPYITPTEYSVPLLKFNPESYARDGSIPPKSLLDYLGVPAGTSPREINALPVRGFCKIWNEWFRDQNLQNAINVPTTDVNLYYSSSGDDDYFWRHNEEDSDAYINNTIRGGDLPPVNKYHDYFTSALREPQKGDPVPIPLSGFAPVYGNELIDLEEQVSQDGRGLGYVVHDSQHNTVNGLLSSASGTFNVNANTNTYTNNPVFFNNLGADLSKLQGVYATISDLRYAFQLQKFLEADSRGGTRYREILKQHFNVTSLDASQQIPEFLGGKRIPINISQVLQTSATDDVSPQGNTAAYSLTSDKYGAFTKSFTEHGFLFCVGCIRTDHTYQQGIEKFWSRKNKFDYYFPEFANISEQPIYNRELFNAMSPSDYDLDIADQIFGYQEAWADYRYKPNRVSAEFRSTYPQALDIWHYADYYDENPYLSSNWIRETRKNLDRTLAVSSNVSDQFIADFYFKVDTVRVMPAYSIPGLSDHH